MLAHFKELFNQHKKKIIVVGVVIGSTIVGSKYAHHRLIDWQEKETKDFLEKTRKQQYFESCEKLCNQTILFLSPTLRDNILELVDCESIVNQLKDGAANKFDLWQELKMLVFTKVTLLIYSGTLLVVALRIQLNIIGGHIYCKTCIPSTGSTITNNLQEKYLSKCYYFLKEGMTQIFPLVQEKVFVALKDVSLNQSLSLQQVENIFWAIQCSINEDSRSPLRNMSTFLYGCQVLEEEDTFIQEMMLDTTDLLQSPEVIDIASSCINRGFSCLVDKIAEFFLPQEKILELPNTFEEVNNPKFTHPNNVTKPLAKIIPIINGFGNPGTFDVAEAWISQFIYMDRLKMLGANIYESYSFSKT